MPRTMSHSTHSAHIPEIQTVAQIRFLDAHEPMPDEAHEDAFELLYLHSGRKRLLLQGIEYDMRGGDLLVIAPGESHGGSSLLQTRTTLYYLLIAHPGRFDGFCGMDDDERLTLAELLIRLSPRKRALSPEGQRLMRALQRPFDGPLRRAQQRAALISLLSEIVKPQSAPVDDLPEDIRTAIDAIAAARDEMYSVQALASLVNLSESRFKQKFKQALGVPPAEYIVREKIAEAQLRLSESTDRVTDIAMALGFSSSQHFSILFKRFTGIPPIEYRKSAGKYTRKYDDTD